MAQLSIRPQEEMVAGRLDLMAQLERMLATCADFPVALPYAQGQVAALDWLLGHTKATPLTLRPGANPEDVREIDRDADRATDMLQGRTPMDLRGQHFVAGVEFVLMWARYQTVDPEL
jgi:hypothetical protein